MRSARWDLSTGEGMPGLASGRIARRAAAFYAANLVSSLLPLVSVPYLTRTLGPASWGELAIAQAAATALAVLVDYGHAQSATRAVLSAPTFDQRRVIATETLVAKLLLAVSGACGLWLLAAAGALPVGGEFLVAAAAAGTSTGFSPLWLAQAGDRIHRFLGIDVAAKAASVGALFLVVRGPEQAPLVLWVQAVAGGLALLGGLVCACLPPAPRLPGAGQVLRSLREHRHGFLFRATILSYTTANTLVLGMVASTHAAGLYAAADRAVRLVACFAGPLGQAVYPLLARAWRDDPAAAWGLAARLTIGVAAVGAVLSVALVFGADRIAIVIFGSGFAEAAQVLRLLAPLPLLICVSNILGVQWMFSIGAEGTFTRILATAGLVCVTSGVPLGSVFGAKGMAMAATVAELVVTAGIVLHLWWTRKMPATRSLGSGVHAH
jgi:O-antigen/teichoic acid export membrane protein